MKTIHVITGEHGAGKSQVFNSISANSATKLSWEAIKDPVAREAALGTAIVLGKPIILLMVNSVVAEIERRPDLDFLIYLVDADYDQLLSYRQKHGKDPTQPANEDILTRRLAALDVIFEEFGYYRGAWEDVLQKLTADVRVEAHPEMLLDKSSYVYEVAVVQPDGTEKIVYAGKGSSNDGYDRIQQRWDIGAREPRLKEAQQQAFMAGFTWLPRMVQDGLNEIEAYELESVHYKKLADAGQPLINRRPGGLGGWRCTPETIALIKERQRATLQSPEYRKRLSDKMKEVMARPGQREKMSAAVSLRNSTPEWRANQSQKMRGKVLGPHSDEAKAKISEAAKNRVVSDETRQILSDSRKGIRHSDETRQKLSSAQKGKPKTAEHRANISAGKMGKPRDAATRQKLSIANLGKKVPRPKTLVPAEVNFINSTRAQPLPVNADGTYFLNEDEFYALKLFRLREGKPARKDYKPRVAAPAPVIFLAAPNAI